MGVVINWIAGEELGKSALPKVIAPLVPDQDVASAKATGEVTAIGAALALGPTAKPFRRPAATPDTLEQRRADRRRSITAAMRRRAASSILTSAGGDGGDTLGA